ncbi:MAG: PLDc N-terminal domain-containing protein [Acidimicrobiia bacterium]|nr:PLDc N-terminal domain-containing protein [Acidimicrobiia bacterium]
MVIAAFGTGQVLWSTFWFFIFFIWIMLLFHVFGDIFRSPDLSGASKALWSIFVILLPYLGVFVYLIARGDNMQQHAIAQAQAQEAATQAYIRSVAQSEPTPS